MIDVDELRRSWPSPPDDPFRTVLALENVRALASNFRRAGAQVLVLAAVVQTRDELERYVNALAARRALHIHLAGSEEEVLTRLRRRHDDDHDARDWHVKRYPELAEILDRAGFSDELRINTTGMTVAEVTQRVFTAFISASRP